MPKKLVMGNEAVAYAALDAGVAVAAGYPGTPSSEVIETIAKLRASGVADGVHVEWSTNEKAALEVAFAASLSGARAMFTCKQMGLNVASDALLSLNYVGVRGGLVLYVADDPGPISSQTEQDTRRFAAFAKVPVLDPATPEQLYDMVGYAFELSETYGTPVIVRPTTRVCHASTFIDVPEKTSARPVPEGGFEKDDARWVIFPSRSYRAHKEINDRLEAIAQDFSAAGGNGAATVGATVLPASDFNPIEQVGENPKLGIMVGGVSSAYVREALALLESDGVGLGAYRLMQVGTPYPFPEADVLQFVEGLEHVIVFEELDYVLEDELFKLAGKHHLALTIHGKLDKTTPDRGELSTESCFAVLVNSELVDAAAGEGSGSPRSDRLMSIPASREVTGIGEAAERTSEASSGTACCEGDNEAGEGSGSPRSDRLKSFPDSREATFIGEAAERTSEASSEAARRGGDSPSPLLSRVEQVEPPARPPVLCAGCPHRGSFLAVKRALRSLPGKPQMVLCGDIGCYTLGNAKPLDAVDTCLCMGAGITMAQGFAAVEPGRKAVAFVGDSTFFASGLTGVANAVFNNHDITVVVLDNSTTAMTGGQPHPGTGNPLMGGASNPIDIEGVLRALGVGLVKRANPFDFATAKTVVTEAVEFSGPSAVIFEGPCVQLVAPKATAHVNAPDCTACRACITALGCPAMNIEPDSDAPNGTAMHIDANLCTGCGLCVPFCSTSAIKVDQHD